MLSLLLWLAISSHAAFGEIYGDLRFGDKYVADAKVHLVCGSQSAEATTDKSGSFRLTVPGTGKCQFSVAYDKQNPSIDVVLFDQAARYRFVIESKDGKYTLKRV